jgi:hypothetical protein
VPETIAGVGIPGSARAEGAISIVREATDDLLFHDLGLTEKYRSNTQRFEVDGADLARADVTNRILRACYDGMNDRSGRTFGMMNADVLAAFEPSFSRTDFVSVIRGNDWPE